MAKASGATQKSKCPPQSVSASGDPINEYIKNVSKNIKKGKGDKGCKGCDQALNVSLGLRSIYRVLGDSKFVAEAFKTTKEENLPDFSVVETDIKRMIKFSAELFGVLGGDTSIQMEGVTPIDKDIVQAGITSAQQLTTGITELGKLNEAIQKLKGDSSEGIKTLNSQYKQMLDLINISTNPNGI